MTLTRELKRRGVNVIARTAVDRVDTGANLGATVHYRQGDSDEDRTAYGEVVLAAIGRVPNTDADWFRSSGPEVRRTRIRDRRRIRTDEP